MELVSAVFNDIEVHFMRGMARVFKRPTEPLKSATLWAGDRALYATYTLTNGAKDCVRAIIGREYAAGPAVWKHLWPDFTGLPGPTPLSLDTQFFRLPHDSGTSDAALHAAALALIKSIDAALKAEAPARPAVRYAHYVRALAGGQWELTACDGSVAPMGISNVAGCPRCSALIIAPEPNKGSWEVARVAKPASPPPDANCVTRPDGECVSERPCMHSKQREENKAAVAALPCFICGPVCDPAKHQPQAARYALPASPPCPGCGKPKRDCLELPPKYAGCTAWRAPAPEGAKVEHTASRLDGVVGFQLRPPPQELVVLVDDQSEPP